MRAPPAPTSTDSVPPTEFVNVPPLTVSDEPTAAWLVSSSVPPFVSAPVTVSAVPLVASAALVTLSVAPLATVAPELNALPVPASTESSPETVTAP